jgi:hypothetical protein
MSLRYRPDPLPPSKGLEDEDNYQILVYDREGGDLLGVAFRTSMNGLIYGAMKEAAEAYPGRYLVETNGPYIIRTMTAATGAPDEFGWIDGNDMPLDHLPQWFGLVAKCKCGYLGYVDRYDPRILRWKRYRLSYIAGKLSCDECKRKERPRMEIKLGLRKLPR